MSNPQTIEIVDQIDPHLAGAPQKLVCFVEDGQFFIGRREGDKIVNVTPPTNLMPVAQMARAVVAGDPRANTAPGALLGIATALLVALYLLGASEQALLGEMNGAAPAPAGESGEVA